MVIFNRLAYKRELTSNQLYFVIQVDGHEHNGNR